MKNNSRKLGVAAASGFSFFALGIGLGAGALAMFLLDPQSGRRRRALVTDKGTSLANRGSRALTAKARDIRNRLQGAVAQAKPAIDRVTNTASEALSTQSRSTSVNTNTSTTRTNRNVM